MSETPSTATEEAEGEGEAGRDAFFTQGYIAVQVTDCFGELDESTNTRPASSPNGRKFRDCSMNLDNYPRSLR